MNPLSLGGIGSTSSDVTRVTSQRIKGPTFCRIKSNMSLTLPSDYTFSYNHEHQHFVFNFNFKRLKVDSQGINKEVSCMFLFSDISLFRSTYLSGRVCCECAKNALCAVNVLRILCEYAGSMLRLFQSVRRTIDIKFYSLIKMYDKFKV